MNGAPTPEATDGAGAESGLLEVRDLVKHFPIKSGVVIDRVVGRVRAVDGVTLDGEGGRDAGPGRRVGLRQVHALSRGSLQLIPPTSGSVRFDGQDSSAAARARCVRSGGRCR